MVSDNGGEPPSPRHHGAAQPAGGSRKRTRGSGSGVTATPVAKNYGDVYNIEGWGDPYFAVNKDGHLSVRISGRETIPGQEIDVLSVIQQATTADDNKKKLQFPMILRFPDVLRHRLDSLHAAFANAIKYTGYGSVYQGVFPVKVNQHKAVVQDMVHFGYEHSYGLEAGSKPELLIAMSCLTRAKPGAYLVCNGNKDSDYIALALAARAMGLNAIIVLEMEEELDIVIEQSSKLGVEPVIGVRAKLLTKIPGHFGSTAGKHGKFGLPAKRIYEVAKKLKALNKLHWLKLLHFHVGSMIPTKDIVFKAASESSDIYCTLVKECGAEMMTTLDCGGGLGVDYDGTRSGSSDMSVAYGLEGYASSIVQAVRLRCDYHGVPHPVLCTESGRAMASHHSMIILEALSAIPEPKDDDDEATTEQLHGRIRDLSSKLQPTAAGMSMSSHAVEIRKHGIEMYKLSKKLSKSVTADAHTIYNYHMNLSIFSLIPDYWGIQQLFPMIPVSRLDEKPTHRATLVDLTCDSDGKVDKFIGDAGTLPLHPLLDPNKLGGGGGYYVAVLVSGAYQEALSSKHNLYGGPSLVRVLGTGDDGAFRVEATHLGPTTEEIVGTMRYDVKHDISSVIEERAREKEVWGMVGKLVEKGLHTMPYLLDYKPPPTA